MAHGYYSCERSSIGTKFVLTARLCERIVNDVLQVNVAATSLVVVEVMIRSGWTALPLPTPIVIEIDFVGKYDYIEACLG